MIVNCGDCRLGIIGGAVCSKCEGTMFVTVPEATETVVEQAKKVLKKK